MRPLGALTRACCVCLLGHTACVRFGYENEARVLSHDASTFADAATDPDAEAGRASMHPDAATSGMDASVRMDAATSGIDAAYAYDASASPLDASIVDASVPDAGARPDAASSSDAAVGCTSNISLDYCSELPPLAAMPNIDGKLDCGPSLIDLPAIGWTSSTTLPSDNHARYAAAWHPQGLYFYVEVDDALLLPASASVTDPWCGDGVELYADNDGVYTAAPDYDNPGTIQLLATSPASDGSTTGLAVDARYHTRSAQRVGDWDPIWHRSVLRPGGYALEAFVRKEELDVTSWTLAAGGKVGFDIAINVSITDSSQKTVCGDNLGQYYLRVTRTPCTRDNCRPYSNVAAFCTPTLD